MCSSTPSSVCFGIAAQPCAAAPRASGVIPRPGRSRFTAASPTNSAIVVTTSKYTIAFRPMRPICFRSPAPAIPYTSVPKISGARIDLISLRNTVADRAQISLAAPGATPRRTPRPPTIPTRIQAVSGIRAVSPFAPLKFLPQHVEERFMRRPHQIKRSARAPAFDAVPFVQRLAHLAVHRQER